jgi:hypothetical protein
MASSTVTLKAAGLVTSPNELNRPEGSLIEASNVVIRRDGVIEQRRGFATFGDAFPSSTNRAKQLGVYRGRILRHYNSILQYDSTGDGDFESYSGSVAETSDGLRIKFTEANGNLFFTTSSGIKKLSAANASQLSEISPVLAGAVKALDLNAKIVYETGFLAQDSVVAYRVLWNKKDNNQNLISGTPSQRAVIYNPMTQLVLKDFAEVLSTLDNLENSPSTTARISDGNYISTLLLPFTATGSELRTNLIALATKLDTDIILGNNATAPLVISGAEIESGVCTVTFSSGNPTDYLSAGDTVRLSGFSLATQNEIQTLTFSSAPTAGTFTLRSGTNETGVLNWNDNATTIQTALRLVSNNQNVVVTGSIAGGLTLTYITADGDMPQVQTGATNTLVNGATPVTITGATTQEGFSSTSGSLNEVQTLSSLTSTTIVFNTTAQGSVSIASGVINSNFFREIEEPVEPSIPATNDDLVAIQDYLDDIIGELQDLPTSIIAAGTDKDNIDLLTINTTTNVELSFTIPAEVAEDSSYFYQVYRSQVAQATGSIALDDISPTDELQLVYEDYPTAAELASGLITIEDVTPDDFMGANLYTNTSSGEGITQANDQPPIAKDINRYRNAVFFANTKTKQRLSVDLIGVQNMIDDYDAGNTPKITITDGDTTNTYNFVTGQQQITEIDTVADVADSLNGKYFLYNTPTTGYYVWFNTTGGVDPAISGRTGIEVNITTGDSANTVAEKLYETLAVRISEFVVSVNTNTVEIINSDVGHCTDATVGDSGFTVTVTQDGRGERIQPQITSITAIAGSSFVSVGTADYFTINSAFNQFRYLVWFNRGSVTEPSVSGKTNLQVTITGSETAAEVAQKIIDVLPEAKFETSLLSATITVTNVQSGSCTNATEVVSNAGFTVSTTQEGAIDVLLSPDPSPAQAVDETARSLVRVINRNDGESVYAFYLSGAFDIPGKLLLEARELSSESNPFYLVGNNDDTGASFSPNIAPELTISNIATGASTSVITTTTAHGLTSGDEVIIGATDSQPIIDGVHTVTVLTSTTFSIPAFVSIAGSEGCVTKTTNALYSENEEKPNRVYYSKTSQPEAVPIVNYFDVGASDKEILRIVPLRDSLFVFKEDGLYRISGEVAPFQLELFDNSFIVKAADSVAVANNAIFGWTTQGVQQLTEGGAYVISRNIDNILLKLQTYTNFDTATWGIGYESDNSYIVFTTANREDEDATIAYRYSTLTQTWTTYDKSSTCGVINNSDDKLYLGASDVAYIEKERKNFDRTDYADREHETTIGSGAVQSYTVTLPDVSDFDIGDVFVQEQSMTVYDYNGLLKKLDLDTGVGDSDYFETLEMVRGDSPRNKLEALATKLDADPNIDQSDFAQQIATLNGTIASNTVASATVITDTAHGLITGRVIRIASSNCTPSIDGEHEVTVLSANTFSIPVAVTVAGTAGTWETVDDDFDDIETCFNKITSMLNADIAVNFANYKTISNTTIQESIIVDINRVTRKITLNLLLDYMVGVATVFKAITSTFTYSPNTMGDPLMLKHLSESTLMLETRNITSGVLSFATDLLPEFKDIEFDLDGNGIFGHSNFGAGNFGGIASGAPFRTFIPRQCQRCRYIVAKFEHSTAREDYKVLGLTITGNIGQSTRAFR